MEWVRQIYNVTRSPQGLYNFAAYDVTNPNLSPLLSLAFQKHPILLGDSTQVTRSVTLLHYGLKILTESWIEGESPVYPDHPPRRCHSELSYISLQSRDRGAGRGGGGGLGRLQPPNNFEKLNFKQKSPSAVHTIQ